MFSIYFIFTTSIIGILLILFLWSRRKYYLLNWKIGGPLGYPFFGICLDVYKQEYIIDYFSNARKEHGPFISSYLGITPVFVISEPIALEKILTSTAFVNKSFVYHALKLVLGDGLINLDKPKWSQHRKLLTPTFNHKLLISFYPIFNKQIKILNGKLKSLVGKGPMDFQIVIQTCALDIACQTTMGVEMNFQSGKNPDIIRNYENLSKYTSKRMYRPWYFNDFVFSFFPSDSKPYYKAIHEIQHFVQNLIKRKINSSNSSNDLTDKNDNSTYTDDDGITKQKNIFIDLAINLMSNNSLTESQVRDHSNTMVAAAFETTATVVHTTLICLAMFPKYQDIVFDEILSVFPEKEFEATYDDTQQLVYLEMVINETMRFLAPIPLIARTCTEDFDFGNGVTIPKDIQVIIDIFNMQRCEKIWGPKSKTFYPDHFLKDNISRMHPYSFMGFSKGIRNCIGSRYAMMSLKVFLSQILRSYRFTTDFKVENLKCLADITLKFSETPLLQIHERNV